MNSRMYHLILSLALVVLLALPIPAKAQDITSGLVGWWRLDEPSGTVAADSSGNSYNGTLNGTNFTTASAAAQLGSGFDSDGINDFINLGTSAGLKPALPASFAAWIYLDDPASNGALFANDITPNYSGLWVQITSNIVVAQIGSNVGTGPSSRRTKASNVVFNDPGWYHVAVIWRDITDMDIYVNGVNAGGNYTGTGSGLIYSGTTNSYLGQRNLEVFPGIIDDARFYNRALSAPDIQALYELREERICESEADSGKIIYNPDYRVMEFCNGSDWISMGKEASILHGQKTEGENYNINAVSFDGVTDTITVNNPFPSDSKQLTGSFWVKMATATGLTDISGPFGTLRMYRAGSNPPMFRVETDGAAGSLWSGTALDNTNWNHVMFSFDLSDPAKRHLYINGVDSFGSAPVYNDVNMNLEPMANFRLGGRDAANLDPFEMADFWLKSGLYIDLSDPEERAKFISEDGRAVNLGTDGSLPTGSAPDIFLSGDTATWHTNKGTGGGFTETGALTDATSLPPTQTDRKLVGWWKLDETSGNFEDSIGGLDAVPQGGVSYAPNAGVNGGAVEFDGVNGCLRVTGYSENMSNEGSYSYWMKVRSLEDYDGVISASNTSLTHFMRSAYTLRTLIDDANGGDFPYNKDTTTPNSTISLNVWDHYVLTYSNAVTKTYKNGVEIQSSNGTALTPTFRSPNGFWFGCDRNIGTRSIDGFLDDIRIYNYALSADEAAELFHASNEFYAPQAVNFDGTNDYLHLASGLTGTIDTKTMTGSVWMRAAALDTPGNRILQSSPPRFNWGYNNGTQRFDVIARNASNSIVVQFSCGNGIPATGQWYHMMFSIDLNNAANRHCYLNDTSSYNHFSYVDDLVDVDGGTQWRVGANTDGPVTGKWNGDIADLWLDFGTYIDFSVEANRRKFITADGEAKYLGDDGSLITGAVPDIFLSGDTASWHTNKGTGGGFTELGALTDATISPNGEAIPRYCSNPVYPEGTLIFNSDENVMQYCDGYRYIPLGPVGDGGGGCSSPSGAAGDIIFNSTFETLQYCEGNEWVGVGHDTSSVIPKWQYVSVGNFHTCGITLNGEARCWGRNFYGTLGNGQDTVNVNWNSIPVSGGYTWKNISAGSNHTCGVRSDDIAMCWGRNVAGEIGNNTLTPTNVPVVVNGGYTWRQVEAAGGDDHSCGVTLDNIARCWGDGYGYALGESGQTDRLEPNTVRDGHLWQSVDAGYWFGCGVTSTNEGRCWGAGNYGRLGYGGGSSRNWPNLVNGGHSWIKISNGDNSHACGIISDGRAKCWGRNYYGEVGDGTQIERLSTTFVDGGHTYTDIATGNYHSCGLRTDNTILCWGYNLSGQLGNGSTTLSSLPVLVSGGYTWKKLSAGGNTTCAIRSDDVMMCWGNGFYGGLGSGNQLNSSVPVIVK